MDNQYYLFAKDDIYEESSSHIIYLKDELIGSLSILKKSKDIKTILPRGVYYVQDEHNEIHIEERVDNWQYFDNILMYKQYIFIYLNVIDSIKKEIIEGVHCGVFAYEDIYDINNCLVYFKDDLIMDVYSSKDNIIKVPLFHINKGTFYIQQINTVEGYFGSTEQYLIRIDNSIGIKEYTITIENMPTRVDISKRDENNEYVKGVWLAVYDERDNLVDEWISDKEHSIYNLSIGHRYIIKEKHRKKGYVQIQRASFIVEGKRNIQRIVINDEEVIH